MKLFLAVLVLAISGATALAGCAASTAEGTSSTPDPKPATVTVVEKVGVRPASNDLGPDNVQK